MSIANSWLSLRRVGQWTGGLLLLLAAGAQAGSLNAPAAPTDPGSALYNLQSLCDRLSSGAAGAKRSSVFVEPAVGPAATMCTLNAIMAAMPALDNAAGATVAQVRAGKTFWGLTGGAWGKQTGAGTGSVIPMTGSFPVAQTGQTTSYATGDDGGLRPGVAWPNPRFSEPATPNGTVTDNLTGLVWLKNANCAGVQSWAAAMTWAANLASGNCGLSDGSVAGQWRLPNIKELTTLVHSEFFNPAVPNTAGTGKWTAGDPFAGVQSGAYWSSTTAASVTSDAWYVALNGGYVDMYGKTATIYVWPVRGGL